MKSCINKVLKGFGRKTKLSDTVKTLSSGLGRFEPKP
jgi:hypothetical protein